MRKGLVVVLGLAAACNGTSGGVGTPTTPTTPTTVPATTTTQPAGTTTKADGGCDSATAMVGSGSVFVSDPVGSDTGTVGSITWTVEGDCERFTIEFETAEGAPATTPPRSSAEVLHQSHILRVRVEADSTVITDQLVETPLVRRLYVVRALEGGLFIDLHLTRPVLAAATQEESPARLTVEIEPGDAPATAGPQVGDRVVVIDPLQGADVETDLVVSGYSRTFEANVLIIVTEGDEVVTRASGTAADWTETWGEFAIPVTVPPGESSLFVGEESPADGSLDGVIVNVTVR